MSGDERVDGEGWRRGYDDWKADAPDTGAGGYEDRPCAVCGATKRKPNTMTCANGHTPREQDAAYRKQLGLG